MSLPARINPLIQNELMRRGMKKFRSLYHILNGSIARQGYLAALDQGVISVANFVAAVYIGRTVSPTEFGIYGVGFTATRIVRAFQDGIITQPLNAFGAALDDEKFKTYFSTVSLLQVILAVLSALAAIVLGWILTSTGNDMAGPAIFSLWCAFLFWQLQEFLRTSFYVRGRVMAAVVSTIVSNIVRLSFLVWFNRIGKLNAITGLYTLGLGSAVVIVINLWQTRKYWSRKILPLYLTWKENWKFGRWVLGGSIMNWIVIEFYPVLTAGMINFAAAGAYRAIQNLVAPVLALLRAADTFLTPRIAKQYAYFGYQRLRRMLNLTYLILSIPIIGLLGVSVIFPRQILQLLYGNTYVEFSQGVPLMAAFYLLCFLYIPLQSAYKAIHSTNPIFIANLLAMLVMFTIGLMMINIWGVYGTISGQALNALIINVFLWVNWWRVSHRIDSPGSKQVVS